MLVCFFILHARLRAHRAPGIPCALSLWAEQSCITRAHCVAGRGGICGWLVRRRPKSVSGGCLSQDKPSAFVNQTLRGAAASARKSRVLLQNGSLHSPDV